MASRIICTSKPAPADASPRSAACAVAGRELRQHLLRRCTGSSTDFASRSAHAGRLSTRSRTRRPSRGSRSRRDVALALQAVDGQRHRRDGDAHVPGEVGHRHRVDLVEMVEDARLVRADVVAGLRVRHVPRVAGEVDPRVGVEDLADVTDRVLYFALSNQNNRTAKNEPRVATSARGRRTGALALVPSP